MQHELLTEMLPRDEYLSYLGTFEHVILLPMIAEGFYLPALEAMALGVTVVMPDCIGARSYAIDNETCAVTPRNAIALAEAAIEVAANPLRASRLRDQARLISGHYDIATEQRKLIETIEKSLA
jgi:glycosyltransferase involved in cell wall biosynthesis